MSLDGLVKDIKSMKYQGATQIAVASLKFIKKTKIKNFNTVAKKLEKARPTAVVLHNCLEIIKKDKSIKTINRLLTQLRNSSKRIGDNGSKLVKKDSVVMTHCHSSEVVSVLKNSKKIKVIVTETRPFYQGLKTAKDLADSKIPVTYIVDSAAGYYINNVDMIIVGADAMRKEGVVNKIGTYMLALLAKKHKKPFYVVGNTLKLDKRKKLTIEMRSPKEIHEKIKGVKIENPVFDLTPWGLVTRVITEKGVMTPGNVLRLLK